MLIYNSNQEKIKWRVGETVNSHAFHACIHGFESRTRHHKKTKALYKVNGVNLRRFRLAPFFLFSLNYEIYAILFLKGHRKNS